MVIWLILIVCAYLLGSLPTSYLFAKSRGIDLRQQGTGQVGGGNLWRMTSWKLGLPVSVIDAGKGLGMVWVTELLGLGVAAQIAVGLAAVIGHNWPVFLRFHGGRGVGIVIGILTILPFININNVTPWPSVAFWAILIIGRLALGSSPLPVLAGVVAAPLISWGFHEPLPVTLAFLGMFLVIVIKRLTAQASPEAASISRSRLLFNRFFFDRDISDRNMWINRKAATLQK